MQILHALRIYYILQAIAVRALLLRPRGKYFFRGFVEEFDLGSSQRQATWARKRAAAGGTALGARLGPSLSDGGKNSAGESWGKSPWGASDNQDRWEKAWLEGEEEKRASSFLTGMADWGSGKSGELDVETSMPVEVVSFDLDDTLWSTKAVIEGANTALQEHLQREHPTLAEKCVIADLMKEVWKERLVADPTLDTAPVNLTELRKAGLARACEVTGADPSAVVESSFEVWRKARHDVEPHLFPGVLETLKALRERGVRLVAITNGNAQTDDIPCLRDLFEISVMAEEVGERKPQAGPFREAVKKTGYPSEDHVGGEWVHVGDDWATDCVGAKTMRMRTILVRVPGKPRLGETPEGDEDEDESDVVFDTEDEDRGYPVLKDESVSDSGRVGAAWRVSEEKEKVLRRAEKLGLTIKGDFDVAAGVAGPNRNQNEASPKEDSTSAAKGAGGGGRSRSTLDSKSYGKELSAIAIGEYSTLGGPGKLMGMGSSSYVMDMLMKDFMDVSLDNITEVLATVDRWNAEYSAASASRGGEGGLSTEGTAAAAAPTQQTAAAVGGAARRSGGKFCTECGMRIPATAKFCSECGTKQESVDP